MGGRALEPCQPASSLAGSAKREKGGQGGLGEEGRRARGEGGTRTKPEGSPTTTTSSSRGVSPRTQGVLEADNQVVPASGRPCPSTVQMQSFQGHVCTGPWRGCVCARE